MGVVRLLEMGCIQTMVQHDLVDDSKPAMVICVARSNALYPLADAVVQVKGLELTIRATISNRVIMSVLLVTDVLELR